VADFLRWHQANGCCGFNEAIVQQYRAELENAGLSPSTINLKLTAVRRLAAEAADNGWQPATNCADALMGQGSPGCVVEHGGINDRPHSPGYQQN
jgi:hypothetical protein